MLDKLIAMNSLLIYMVSFIFNLIFVTYHLQTKLIFLFFLTWVVIKHWSESISVSAVLAKFLFYFHLLYFHEGILRHRKNK